MTNILFTTTFPPITPDCRPSLFKEASSEYQRLSCPIRLAVGRKLYHRIRRNSYWPETQFHCYTTVCHCPECACERRKLRKKWETQLFHGQGSKWAFLHRHTWWVRPHLAGLRNLLHITDSVTEMTNTVHMKGVSGREVFGHFVEIWLFNHASHIDLIDDSGKQFNFNFQCLLPNLKRSLLLHHNWPSPEECPSETIKSKHHWSLACVHQRSQTHRVLSLRSTSAYHRQDLGSVVCRINKRPCFISITLSISHPCRTTERNGQQICWVSFAALWRYCSDLIVVLVLLLVSISDVFVKTLACCMCRLL